jgi:hypothetical protein
MIQGGFFGGSRAGILAFYQHFWARHDYFIYKGYFVGKDQEIMTSLTLDSPLEVLLIPSYAADRSCGDIWFYFFQFLARSEVKASWWCTIPTVKPFNIQRHP